MRSTLLESFPARLAGQILSITMPPDGVGSGRCKASEVCRFPPRQLPGSPGWKTRSRTASLNAGKISSAGSFQLREGRHRTGPVRTGLPSGNGWTCRSTPPIRPLLTIARPKCAPPLLARPRPSVYWLRTAGWSA